MEVSSADIFLYNNSATAGRRGLAVFSMSIIDGQGHLLHSSSIGVCNKVLSDGFSVKITENRISILGDAAPYCTMS